MMDSPGTGQAGPACSREAGCPRCPFATLVKTPRNFVLLLVFLAACLGINTLPGMLAVGAMAVSAILGAFLLFLILHRPARPMADAVAQPIPTERKD